MALHASEGCLEVRGEIIGTVLCCIVYWIEFSLTGPILLCKDSFVFMCLYFVFFLLHICHVIVPQ